MDWHTARKTLLRVYAVGFLLFGLVLLDSALATDDRVTRVLLLLPGFVSLAQGVGLLFLHWVARILVPVAFMVVVLVSLGGVIVRFSLLDLALVVVFGTLRFIEYRFENLDRDIFSGGDARGHPRARR